MTAMLMLGWVPIVGGLALALVLDARGVGAPPREHECAWCRYDLRGAQGERCPECGAERAEG